MTTRELALFELPQEPVVRRGLAPERHAVRPKRGGLLRKGINDTYRRDTQRHLQLYREAVRLLIQNATREAHRS